MRATPCGPGRRYPQIGKGPRDRKHRQSPARRALPRAGAPRPRRCHGDVRAHARAASRCPRCAPRSRRARGLPRCPRQLPAGRPTSLPLGVFVLTAAASATINRLGYGLGPPFGATVALYFVAADERTRHHVRRTAAVVVGIFGLHVAATASADSGFPTSAILFGVVVWGGAWMIGDQVRQRRRRRLEVEERLTRAERETARERRLAAAEERTRIARDLHDSAAHAINVILVQAGAARLLQERIPPRSGRRCRRSRTSPARRSARSTFSSTASARTTATIDSDKISQPVWLRYPLLVPQRSSDRLPQHGMAYGPGLGVQLTWFLFVGSCSRRRFCSDVSLFGLACLGVHCSLVRDPRARRSHARCLKPDLGARSSTRLRDRGRRSAASDRRAHD